MLEQQRDPADVIAGQIVPYEIYVGFYVFDVGKGRHHPFSSPPFFCFFVSTTRFRSLTRYGCKHSVEELLQSSLYVLPQREEGQKLLDRANHLQTQTRDQLYLARVW